MRQKYCEQVGRDLTHEEKQAVNRLVQEFVDKLAEEQKVGVNHIGPTLKKCWFDVLLPTHQNWPYPRNCSAILENFFFS